jgi:signal transduction histidine kinase
MDTSSAASAAPEAPADTFADWCRALAPGLLMLNAGGELLFASPAAWALLGAASDEEVAARLAALGPALEERLLAPARRGEAAEATLEVAGAPAARRLLLAAHPLPAGAERSPATALLLRDADLHAGLAEDLRLAAHMRAVTAITPAVAHDLRAPINSMLFNLEVLKETLGGALAGQPGSAERQDRYVRVLREELARLHQGLEVWLAQTAERRQEAEACDLGELVSELAALLVPVARKRQVQVAWEPPAAPAAVQARRHVLKQALLLLGVAALEATPNGTSLALGLATGSERTIASIRSGPREEPREARFQLQITFDGSRTGLYVARALISESGGEVWGLGAPERPAGFELEWPPTGPVRGR